MAVQSGDADFAIDIPIMEADAAGAGDLVNEYVYSTGNIKHLWYNMGENAGATKDIRVRQAIHKALNFEAICYVDSSGHTSTEHSYAGSKSEYATDIWTEEDLTTDIEGAKALLEEAGYGDGLELRILGVSSDQPAYTVIQANLAEIGIKLNIDTPDVPTFVEQGFGGNYDMISIGEFLTYRAPSALSFLVKANVEGPGMSLGGPKWTTDEIDSQITQFITAKDKEEAREVLAAIDQELKDEAVYSPLNDEIKAAVTTKELKGFTFKDKRFYLDITSFYR
jgi:peptide/nickel transport system substrate-binding protein